MRKPYQHFDKDCWCKGEPLPKSGMVMHSDKKPPPPEALLTLQDLAKLIKISEVKKQT